MRKGLIVGIDPGFKTGVSALDLSGKPVFSMSRKNFSIKEVIGFLSGKGDPVIVSTDVRSPPDFVLKVAAAFDAALFSPKKNLPLREKISMVKTMIKEIDKHKRCSMVAALKAYRHFSKRLIKLEKILREQGLSEYEEEAKRLTIKNPEKNVIKIIRKKAAKTG